MALLQHLIAFLGYVVPFVFVLSIVVFFHELGHFLVGRACGVKVDVFSIGFGPELLAFHDRHGTRWRVAALPLGGYVKFHGDANGASMADENAMAGMPEPERNVTFFAQALWKRAAIVAAGPIANAKNRALPTVTAAAITRCAIRRQKTVICAWIVLPDRPVCNCSIAIPYTARRNLTRDLVLAI